MKTRIVDMDDDVYVELEMEDIPTVAPTPKLSVGFATHATPTRKFVPTKRVASLFDFSGTSLSAIQQAYIMAYALRGTQKAACELADVSPRQVKEWNKDEEFDEYLQIAVSMVADTLEQELLKRAMEGSDKLLIKAVEAHKPEKYSPRQNINANVIHSWADLAKQASLAPGVVEDEEEDEYGDDTE